MVRNAIAAFTIFSLALAGTGLAQDWFPVHPGDTWTYEVDHPSAIARDVQVTIDASRNGWFHFDRFLSAPRWMAVSGDRVYAGHRRTTVLVYDFRARVGSSWQVSLDPACTTGQVTLGARGVTVRTPAGVFANCFRFDWRTSCADAGVLSQWFSPGVGLVRWTEASLTGTFDYRLKRAVIGGRGIPSPVAAGSGIHVCLTIDRRIQYIEHRKDPRPVAGPPTLAARLTLTNASGEDLDLHYTGGQVYDLVLRDASGTILWRWSDGRPFTDPVWTRRIADGEQWAIDEEVPLRIGGATLPNGKYTLEFYLTSEESYGGRTSFEVIHTF